MANTNQQPPNQQPAKTKFDVLYEKKQRGGLTRSEYEREVDKLLDKQKKLNELQEEYLDLTGKLTDKVKSLVSFDEKNIANSLQVLNTKQQALNLLVRTGKITREEFEVQKRIIREQRKQLKTIAEINTKMPFFGQALNMAVDQSGKLQTTLDKVFKSLPAGGFLQKALGLDNLGSKVSEGISESIGAIGESLKRGESPMQALSAGMKKFGTYVSGAQLAMAATVGLIAGAFNVLDKFRQSAEETATATGLTVDQSADLVKQSYVLQASSENRLSTQKEILDANVALVKEFGNLNLISADTVQNVAGIADAFGVSVDTVAQVQRSFEQIGNVSPQVASDISTATMALAEAAGVRPAKVMEDIATNAGVASKYFAGNPKALAKSAVEMAKIGLSLGKASTVAEGLLDIEKSLTAQFEASAMIGRQLNFDAARRLAIEGDIAGATKEVLNQVGSIAEFEQMNALQRNAIATATGLTVDELQRSMVLQEKTMNMTAEEAALVSKYGSDLGNINNLTSEEVANRAKSVQATEQLTTSLDKIKSTIMPAIVSLAQALTPVFQLLSFLVESIVAPFKILSALFSWDGDIIKGMSTWQQIIGSILIAYGTLYTINKGIAAYTALTAANAARSLTFAQRRLLIERRNAIYAAIQGGWKAITMGGGWAGLALLAAATAVIGGIVAAVSRQDDMIMSPISGPAGYSRVLSGPEGAYALNDRDTIVAGTNLGGRGGSAPEIDYNRMADAFANAVRSTQIVIGRGAVGAIGEQVKVNNSFA